jgi:hypothetical protein
MDYSWIIVIVELELFRAFSEWKPNHGAFYRGFSGARTPLLQSVSSVFKSAGWLDLTRILTIDY